MLSSPTPPSSHQGERIKLPCITHFSEEGGGDTLALSLTNVTTDSCSNVKFSDLETQQLFKFKRKQAAAAEDVVYHERRAEELSKSLQTVKETIEQIYAEQQLLQNQINETTRTQNIEHLVQIKAKQQKELLDCLELEDEYIKDLGCIHRLLRQSQLTKRNLNDEILNYEVQQLNTMYNSQKTTNFQNRMRREELHGQVVQKSKFAAMKNYVKAVLGKKLEAHEHVPQKPEAPSKEARNKLQYHIRKTLSRRRRLEEESQAGKRMTQEQRHKSLTLLKKQILEQRQELEAKRELKIQKEKIRQRKLERLSQQGQNPYIILELLKAQEKIKKAQQETYLRKLRAMQAVQAEYQRREETLKKEARQREKWNQFWKQKLKEKKRQHYNTYVKPFLATSPRKFSRTNKWVRVLQENYPAQGAAPYPHDTSISDNATQETEATSGEEDSNFTKKGITKPRKSKRHKKPSSGTSINLARSTETISVTEDSAVEDEEKLPGNKSKKAKRSRKKEERSDEPTSERSDSTGGTAEEKSGKTRNPNSTGRKKKKKHTDSNKQKRNHEHNIQETAPSGAETLETGTTLTTAESNTESIPALSISPWPHRTIPLGLAQLALSQVHSAKDSSPTDGTTHFASYPPVLNFSNFEIGKTYNVRVSVKNMSRKRLKFSFKEVTEPEITLTEPLNPPPTPVESIKNGDSTESNSTRSAKDPVETDLQEKSTPSKLPRKKISKKGKPSKLNSPKLPKTQILAAPPESTSPPPEETPEKVKPLTYKPSDFIQVHFTNPPLLSPGLQHTFRVTFTPKAQEDWTGSLTFLSEVGPFKIPVEIRKKRFSPHIQIPPGVFTFPPTIIGSAVVRRIKIANTGGLSGRLSQILELNPPQMFDEEDQSPQPTTPIDTSINQTESVQTLEISNPVSPKTKAKAGGPSSRTTSPRKTSRKISTKSTTTGNQKGKKTKKTIRQSPNVQVQTVEPQKSPSVSIVIEILSSVIDSVSRNVFLSYIQEDDRNMSPGQSLTLAILFRPPFISNFNTTFNLHFDDETAGTHIELQLQVTGSGLDIPIQLNPRNSDFKICILNSSYQVQVTATLDKGHKNSHVKAIVPPDVKPFVNVHPPEGLTVSPTSPGHFTVRFTPRTNILQNPQKWSSFFDPVSNIFDFPIHFQAKLHNSVVSSLPATFMAVLTQSELELTPRIVDLGICITTETAKSVILIHNPTSVVQKFGFVDVPEDFLVQPNHGFGFVTPGETVSVHLLFSPETVPDGLTGSKSFHLKLVSHLGNEYQITVKCVIKSCGIKLSPTTIHFPATPCGSFAMAHATLKNLTTSSKLGFKPPVKFVIDLGKTENLQVLPNQGFLDYSEEVRLLILYVASVSDDDVRTSFVEQSRQKYLLKMDSFQRELQAINFHIDNDWMLDENSLPDIPRTHSITSQLSLMLPEHSPRPKEHRGRTAESKIKTSAGNSSKSPESIRSAKSSKGPTSKRSKSPKASNRTSPSSEKSGPLKKPKKKPGPPPLTPKQAFLNDIKARKEHIQDKLKEPFHQPDASKLLAGSLEFTKAKREVLKHWIPVSKSIRLPIHLYYPDKTHQLLSLQLRCALQKPDLILIDDNAVCDFGSTPINSKTLREISVLNMSQVTLKLQCDLLNPAGPFFHANALRPLAPDHVYIFRIYCSPQETREYTETFVISGGESKIIVQLKASGGPPLPEPKLQTVVTPDKNPHSNTTSKNSSKERSTKRKKKVKKLNKSPKSN